ncbi:hypothetical protein N657DRAFT_629943 [Parathielavia appendiculata]|uniref:Uncharacterized protein n=1 Tax=Parathielavia appendiculata TaxID=2587402 RepID=A0AAN6U9G7_9PEZI|nr:hypothetical protein N657DRAFT_629943 [Parathielavia appendiculata]
MVELYNFQSLLLLAQFFTTIHDLRIHQYVHSGRFFLEELWPLGPPGMTVAERQIRQGRSLLSKEAFRNAAEQFDRWVASSDSHQEVSLTALNGTVVGFFNYVGDEDTTEWPGYYLKITNPYLEYYNLDQLTSVKKRSLTSPERAYLAIDVVHRTKIHEVETDKVVGPWDMPDYSAIRDEFQQRRQYWGRAPHPPSMRCPLQCGTSLRSEGGTQGSGYSEVLCAGSQHVDDGSVVILVYPGIPVMDVIADIARPFAMVTNLDWYQE